MMSFAKPKNKQADYSESPKKLRIVGAFEKPRGKCRSERNPKPTSNFLLLIVMSVFLAHAGAMNVVSFGLGLLLVVSYPCCCRLGFALCVFTSLVVPNMPPATLNPPVPSWHRGAASALSTRKAAIRPHRLRRGKCPFRISRPASRCIRSLRRPAVFSVVLLLPYPQCTDENRVRQVILFLTGTINVRTILGMENNEITDGITTGVRERKHRGWEIASLASINKQDGTYIVPSQYNPKQTRYQVTLGDKPKCTCPDHETRGCKCKHIYAVRYVRPPRDRIPADGFATRLPNR